MIITTIPDLSLQYDEALALLRVEWASGQDMRTFRASTEQMMQLIHRLAVRHVLLDMNSVPDISVYDQVWLGTNLPLAVVNIPLERMVLVINRRRVHNQLAIDSLIALLRPSIKFDIQFFSAPVPGMHWLSDYSNELPALLAEWDSLHGPSHSAPGGVSEPRPFYRPRR
ncbi:hypothetical protein [Hymenobacter terrenus]|uniref:hypothetical protein n=1 Tax=Hymenobacter terrenus TaxID=1629124 RepID=UPI00061912E0|nr:hypothetical protein [Hymenobacter terrenus]